MVLHHLIDFCFDGGENKLIQFKNIGARWVKEVNNNCLGFNKQQMKEAVSYLLSNCYFTDGHKIFCQINRNSYGVGSSTIFCYPFPPLL